MGYNWQIKIEVQNVWSHHSGQNKSPDYDILETFFHSLHFSPSVSIFICQVCLPFCWVSTGCIFTPLLLPVLTPFLSLLGKNSLQLKLCLLQTVSQCHQPCTHPISITVAASYCVLWDIFGIDGFMTTAQQVTQWNYMRRTGCKTEVQSTAAFTCCSVKGQKN